MTERTVTIKLNLQDEIGNRLAEIKQQRDALAKTANTPLNLKLNSQIQDQVRSVQASISKAHQAAFDSFKGSGDAMKDFRALGGVIVSQAVVPIIQYQKAWAAAAQASKAFTASAAQALKGVSAEFQKQGNLAKFWGVSGFLNQGLAAISNALRNMLSGSGAGLTSWLEKATKGIEQYRTAMVGASAAMLGFSLAEARSYKSAQNLQKSVLSHLKGKISDQEMPYVKEWLDQASKDDWSQGQTTRLEVYKNVLNKTGLRGEAARKAAQNIEKTWFANQGDLKEEGFTSAQDLIQTATAKTLRGETASKLDAIFGKGFSKKSVTSRIRIMDQMGDKTDIQAALADRPEEVLAKRLAASSSAIGQTVVPVLNTILDAFLKISDAIAKIPGLNSIVGWGTVLAATAAAGLAMTSILGGMIYNFMILRTALAESALAEYAHTAAMWLGSAAAAARTAVTEVLATVTGLFTGEVTLSSIAMAAWNAIMAAGAVVAGIFNLSMLPIIAVLGAAALLIGLVAYKSGLLQAILESLSNINLGRIFKDLRMSDLSKAWNDLAKGFKSPQIDLNPGIQGSNHNHPRSQEGVAKMGLDLVSIVSPFGATLKAALAVQDTLRKIWFNGDYLNKVVSTGLGIRQRMLDLFSWMLGTVRDLRKWLATAMPGAEKEAARKKMVKSAEAHGLEYRLGEHLSHKKTVTGGYFAAKNTNLPIEPEDIPVDLAKLEKEYEDMPGFAEGVAQAVAEGMKGVANSIGTSVGNAIKDWAPRINLPEIKIPGVGTLATAIEELDKALSSVLSTISTFLKNMLNWTTGGTDENSSQQTQKHETDPSSSVPYTRNVPEDKVTEAVKEYYHSNQTTTPRYASGATFISGGMFLGRVDQTEEIIPQATTQRGAGPISRMLAIINEVSPSFDPGQGKQRDAVYAPNYVNIHIDRIEKGVDVDKLLFRIRDELDSHATRTIGYLRG